MSLVVPVLYQGAFSGSCYHLEMVLVSLGFLVDGWFSGQYVDSLNSQTAKCSQQAIALIAEGDPTALKFPGYESIPVIFLIPQQCQFCGYLQNLVENISLCESAMDESNWWMLLSNVQCSSIFA